MVLDSNVFCAPVKLRVLGQANRWLVVFIDPCCFFWVASFNQSEVVAPRLLLALHLLRLCIRLPQTREQHTPVSYFSSWLLHQLAEICIRKLVCDHLGLLPSQHPKILHNSLTHSSYREVLSTLFQPNSAWYAWLQSTVPWQDLHKTWPHYSLHT